MYGRKIIFYTDHVPLVALCKLKSPFGRLGRLLNYLVDHVYEIVLEFAIGSRSSMKDQT